MTNVTSKVCLVSDILYSGRFEVPWHQRYYDWNREQVEELLSDLKEALDSKKACYFLGSIMLVEASTGAPRKINDGQQRLITLSLLIAACCRRFTRRLRDGSRETLALRALFDRPDNQPSRLTDTANYEPRITPPRNDGAKYFQLIRGSDIGTNGLLAQAWNVIDSFVGQMKRSTVDQFFDLLMGRVEISVLDIPRAVDANSVFEALNARGKHLDDVDLLRNRLYSYFSEVDDTARRETVHGNLERTLIVSRNRATIQNYYRCYLQCQYGHLRKNHFYRDARSHIERATSSRNPSDYVYDLVADLGRGDSIELFRTTNSSNISPILNQFLPKVSGKRDLAVLLSELRQYTVSHPLEFALLHRSMRSGSKSVRRAVFRSLNNLTSFVMRTAFVAPKFEPSRFEAVFANCAKKVFEGSDIASLDIMDELKGSDEWNVVNDANFIGRMTEVRLRDGKRALRYLFGINAQTQVGSDVFREEKCSVEHVLPQSEQHWAHWSGFKDTDPGVWVYRTGNMLVLPKGENRPDPDYNRDFQVKKNAFARSSLEMPRTVAKKYRGWTPEVINGRSRVLAEKAAKTWRFSFPKKSRGGGSVKT